ncbi:hypothetical protein MY04_1213 [Flammeovirga sp. MY04]|uniref:hypothetical protein n=1 Tax=Flammeovirga sp. MY04 TaxID=1191459 RepID=UPI0008063FCC|nr:hypothetical protein [Flammeovirga sp. MY04]ANQ48590.1 hypothetical protein MY04_1213 [Flammeovirga sp. MY04]
MKKIILILSFYMISCSSISNEKQNDNRDNDKTDLLIQTDQKIIYSDIKGTTNELPSDGNYLFDIAFSEWDGQSLGGKVTVSIKNGSAKVIYTGEGNLTAEIGEVIDQGIIFKHKSGVWIIGNDESDTKLEEIGGCTGGPSIIDFKNKRYWMC